MYFTAVYCTNTETRRPQAFGSCLCESPTTLAAPFAVRGHPRPVGRCSFLIRMRAQF